MNPSGPAALSPDMLKTDSLTSSIVRGLVSCSVIFSLTRGGMNKLHIEREEINSLSLPLAEKANDD